MKKTITTFLVLTLMCTFVPSQSAQAAPTTDDAAEIALLQSLVAQLTALLAQLIALQTGTTPVVTPSTIKPNLMLAEVSFDDEVLSGNSMGNTLPERELSIRVKNDSIGSIGTPGKKFNYEAVIYEKVSGPDIETEIVTTGEIQIPDGGKEVTFTTILEGGLPFDEDEEDFERTYYAIIMIDGDDEIDETSEKDNTLTSPTWVMEYYKG